MADLAVSRGDGGIVLRWTVPAGAAKRGTFRIYRSALPPGEGCPGCPRTYVPFRVLDLGGLKEGDPAVIEDRDVKEQVLYSYRVVLCDDRGVCGEPSNEVESFFEGKEKNL